MTLQEAREKLELWRAAQDNIAIHGKSYDIEGRTWVSADLPHVNKMVASFERLVASLSGVGRRSRVRGIVPIDL